MPYVTPEASGPLPAFEGKNAAGEPFAADMWEIVAGGHGLDCLGTVELWLRLLASAGLSQATAVLIVGEACEGLFAAVPRSRLSRTYVGHGELPTVFAWTHGHFALGAPTEDAWERFLSAAQRP